MKIALISDLHGAPPPPIEEEEEVDIVLAAGDIDTGELGHTVLTDAYGDIPVITIAGNHEFYGSWHIDIRHSLGVYPGYTEREDVGLGDIRLLACTLWTDFNLYGDQAKAMVEGLYGLNDFRMIRGWSPKRQLEVHKISLRWLEAKLKEPFDGKTIVMTHHCPSHLSVNPKYGCDPLNACFASNLDYLFPHVDLWVHGHTHTPFDYTVGRCRVVCNPMGYKGENPGPYKAKVITL